MERYLCDICKLVFEFKLCQFVNSAETCYLMLARSKLE